MMFASTLVLGFLLGLRHALDADHVAAVATLATGNHSLARTVAQGLAWGAGHTLTLMLFGGAVLVAGAVVPEQAARGLEMAVGVMLVALGADALRRLWRERVHVHAHRHADSVPHLSAHFHAHSHRGERAPHDPARHEHAHPPGFPARALIVGMVHGMAGSAALVLLSLEALRSPAWGLVYIAVFGMGSILGMALLSVAIAVPLRLTSRRLGRAHHGLSATIGFATVMLGGWIVLRVGLELAAGPPTALAPQGVASIAAASCRAGATGTGSVFDCAWMWPTNCRASGFGSCEFRLTAATTMLVTGRSKGSRTANFLPGTKSTCEHMPRLCMPACSTHPVQSMRSGSRRSFF